MPEGKGELENRCGKCNKLLAKGQALNLSIKCPRCGVINHLRAVSPCKEPRQGLQVR